MSHIKPLFAQKRSTGTDNSLTITSDYKQVKVNEEFVSHFYFVWLFLRECNYNFKLGKLIG